MKRNAAERLLDLNYEFYARHGREFASTRQRLQPGVRRLIDRLRGDESVLDLGCGNGSLARELAGRGHRGPYLGVDFSEILLEEARKLSLALEAQFVQADLLQLAADRVSDGVSRFGGRSSDPAPASDPAQPLPGQSWMVVAVFAVLHHIPGKESRIQLLRAVRRWLHPQGMLFLSNWQFLEHARLASRVRPWSAADLEPTEVDGGDHLLDWRHGTPGLRYAHQFDEAELLHLAATTNFTVIETFYSDGADRRSGLYQVWKPDGSAGGG